VAPVKDRITGQRRAECSAELRTASRARASGGGGSVDDDDDDDDDDEIGSRYHAGVFIDPVAMPAPRVHKTTTRSSLWITGSPADYPRASRVHRHYDRHYFFPLHGRAQHTVAPARGRARSCVRACTRVIRLPPRQGRGKESAA